VGQKAHFAGGIIARPKHKIAHHIPWLYVPRVSFFF